MPASTTYGARSAASPENILRQLCEAGRFDAATRHAIEDWGPEILGFLLKITGAPQLASEVFSQFAEDVWRGLPGFRWDSSFRTWAYTLARNAWKRLRRQACWSKAMLLVPEEDDLLTQRRDRGPITLSLSRWRIVAMERIARVRETLNPEDQTLVTLRIDREMSWTEISQIMLGTKGHDPAVVVRKAAALRKRFQRLKEEMRGLLGAGARRQAAHP